MSLVHYAIADTVATLTMDDGKANALSPAMQAAITAGLERAEEEGAAAVVLAGRPGRFSGGFDLAVLREGGDEALRMLRGGFELSARLLAYPRPTVVACTGHAIAMGAFLLCSGDHRVGPTGAFRFQANEVAIGLTVPRPALAILRYRLTPSAFDRAAVLSESFDPEAAHTAGLLDSLAEADEVVPTAQRVAAGLVALDAGAHAATKLRARAALLEQIRSGIEADFGSA